MKTTVSKNQVSPLPSTVAEETISKVPSNDLKLSAETISFHNQKVRDLASMSGLSDVSINLPGCKNPLQAPYTNAALNTMRSEVVKFRERLMYSSPQMIRQDAIEILTLLIRHDRQIGIEDSRTLCEASMAINRAAEGRSS